MQYMYIMYGYLLYNLNKAVKKQRFYFDDVAIRAALFSSIGRLEFTQ